MQIEWILKRRTPVVFVSLRNMWSLRSFVRLNLTEWHLKSLSHCNFLTISSDHFTKFIWIIHIFWKHTCMHLNMLLRHLIISLINLCTWIFHEKKNVFFSTFCMLIVNSVNLVCVLCSKPMEPNKIYFNFDVCNMAQGTHSTSSILMKPCWRCLKFIKLLLLVVVDGDGVMMMMMLYTHEFYMIIIRQHHFFTSFKSQRR